jgi:hypothetical protein
LPDELANPLAVFQSRRESDSFMVLTRLEENGLPVVVTIRRGKGVHEITSVYGKPIGVIQAHATEGTLFVNKQKVRQSTLYKRVQFPKVLSKGGHPEYITERDIVNPPEAEIQSAPPTFAPSGETATPPADQPRDGSAQAGQNHPPETGSSGGKTYSLKPDRGDTADTAGKPKGDATTFDWWPQREPGRYRGITATLSNDGILSFTIEAGEHSPVRGTAMFDRMMEHFGEKVKAIEGTWVYGDNLAAVNKLTGGETSLKDAAATTWTGKRAARHRFTKVKIVAAKGKPGRYVEVHVLFERP